MSRYRKYKWRFYADNNIESEIVEFLRGSKTDVLWIAEAPDLRRQQDDAFHYVRAKELGRYLLTRDLDFWNDQRFPLKDSPGLIILATEDIELSKYLPLLLRKLITEYSPIDEPIYLDGIKMKLDANGITMRVLDRDTQSVSTDTWLWTELV
jgi:predicted nuclease of predicted toxin-antitoxin system